MEIIKLQEKKIDSLYKSQWIRGTSGETGFVYPIWHQTITTAADDSILFSGGIQIHLTLKYEHKQRFSLIVNNNMILKNVEFLKYIPKEEYFTVTTVELLKLFGAVPLTNWPVYPGLIIEEGREQYQISSIYTNGNKDLYLKRSSWSWINILRRHDNGLNISMTKRGNVFSAQNLLFIFPVLIKGFEKLKEALQNPHVGHELTQAFTALSSGPVHDRPLLFQEWIDIAWDDVESKGSKLIYDLFKQLPLNLSQRIPASVVIPYNFLYSNQPSLWRTLYEQCFSFVSKTISDKLSDSQKTRFVTQRYYTFERESSNDVFIIDHSGKSEISTMTELSKSTVYLTPAEMAQASLISLFCPSLCVTNEIHMAYFAYCVVITAPCTRWSGYIEWETLMVTKEQNTTANGYGKVNKEKQWWAPVLNVDYLPLYEEVEKQKDTEKYPDLFYSLESGAYLNVRAYEGRLEYCYSSILAACEKVYHQAKTKITLYVPIIGDILIDSQVVIQIQLIIKIFAHIPYIIRVRIQNPGDTNTEKITKLLENNPFIVFTLDSPLFRPVQDSILVSVFANDVATIVGNSFWHKTSSLFMKETLLATFGNPKLNPYVETLLTF